MALGAMALQLPPGVVVVTSLADSGPGSLRQAIASASAGDTIAFAVTGTIVLSSGELTIGKNLTLDGPGAGALAVSADDSSRVLVVSSGVTAQVNGLTLRDGMAFATGGGVLNNGTLAMANCVVTSNESHALGSSGGGGIFNGGSLTLSGCTVSNNVAHIVLLGGGGILNAGTLQMSGCSVVGNDAVMGPVGGGGILNESFATATIVGSTIAGNCTDTSTGGGVYSAGQLTVIDCTIASNSTVDFGGGIHNDSGGTLFAFRCTFTLNYAYIWGGGLYNNGTATFLNCTLSENLAYLVGGAGLSNISGTLTMSQCLLVNNYFSGIENLGTINLENSILADFYNCLEPVDVLAGVNFATDSTCGPGFTLVTPAQLLLGPLANNGGPTRTHALLPGSVAIDAAACVSAFGLPIVADQRGLARPQGPACDAGPFERAKDG